eukprot:164650-Pleurochrysis_carterae.AAC.1
MYNQAAILWASKKQQSVALSSCEAEIVAASEATKEGVPTHAFYRSWPSAQRTDDTRHGQQISYRPGLLPRASPTLEAYRPASLL